MLYVLAVAISLGEEGAGHLDNSCVICSGCGHLIRRRGSWSLG